MLNKEKLDVLNSMVQMSANIKKLLRSEKIEIVGKGRDLENHLVEEVRQYFGGDRIKEFLTEYREWLKKCLADEYGYLEEDS